MVTGAHTDRAAYVRQAGDELLAWIGNADWEVLARAALEIRYFLQELEAGRLALPVNPEHRLSIEWAREADLPPELDQRFDDLRLLLKDPVWPLPWYEVPSRPVDQVDETELAALVAEFHAALAARDIDRALALCEAGNRSLDITVNLASGTHSRMLRRSLADALASGKYRVGPWSADDLVVTPQFDGRRVWLRHRTYRWTFEAGPNPVLKIPIAMALEAFRQIDGWKLAR